MRYPNKSTILEPSKWFISRSKLLWKDKNSDFYYLDTINLLFNFLIYISPKNDWANNANPPYLYSITITFEVRNWPISCSAFSLSYVNHMSRTNTTMGTVKMTYVNIYDTITQRIHIPDAGRLLVWLTRPHSSFMKTIKLSYLERILKEKY